LTGQGFGSVSQCHDTRWSIAAYLRSYDDGKADSLTGLYRDRGRGYCGGTGAAGNNGSRRRTSAGDIARMTLAVSSRVPAIDPGYAISARYCRASGRNLEAVAVYADKDFVAVITDVDAEGSIVWSIVIRPHAAVRRQRELGPCGDANSKGPAPARGESSRLGACEGC
jgi:hypothetical protein